MSVGREQRYKLCGDKHKCQRLVAEWENSCSIELQRQNQKEDNGCDKIIVLVKCLLFFYNDK